MDVDGVVSPVVVNEVKGAARRRLSYCICRLICNPNHLLPLSSMM